MVWFVTVGSSKVRCVPVGCGWAWYGLVRVLYCFPFYDKIGDTGINK